MNSYPAGRASGPGEKASDPARKASELRAWRSSEEVEYFNNLLRDSGVSGVSGVSGDARSLRGPQGGTEELRKALVDLGGLRGPLKRTPSRL